MLEDLQCVFTLMVQDISSRRLGLVFSQALGLWTDRGLETGGETGLLDYTVVTESQVTDVVLVGV